MPVAWYALVVKPKHEKAVHEHLTAAGYEASLPLYLARRRWSGRYKEIELPLFPGYVFCRFSFLARVRILRMPGVRSIVTAGQAPAPIPHREIAAIEAMCRSGLPVKPWTFLKIGQRIELTKGSLKGLRGVLIQFKKTWHVVVTIELLQRSVGVEVDLDSVTPIK